MRVQNDEEVEKRLLLTKTICQVNVDDAMAECIRLRKKLELAEEKLQNHQNSLVKVEKQLLDFYGQFHSHSKFYKKRL